MTLGIEDIFGKALEIDSADRRAAFVDEACGNDGALRAQVQKLLDAHLRAGSFLAQPALAAHPALAAQPGLAALAEQAAQSEGQTVDLPAIAERPGTIIGRYKLLQQIGEGGFGVVFMAEQLEPVRRKVALKIIKPGMDTKEVIARFEAERQALALMDHPNIAKVFDAGATESGRPYFVMELVKGIPITDYCDQVALTTRERLGLFISVCQAVQHAHQKGIIHRDIKPKNILITLHDGTPVVKVIDFGISKAIDQRLTERTLFTEFGQMIGTPMYMSPEQAEISGLDVDTRTDICSLGVLLYELLTGATPFDTKRLHEAAYDEVRRIIREEEPPMPSKRISTLGKSLSEISAHRKVDPSKLSSTVRGDLDWIVMKALEKDRGRRYVTATAFAADVERHLEYKPIEACPPSFAYRFQKYLRRNRSLVTAAASVVAVALLATLVTASATRWYAGQPGPPPGTPGGQRIAMLINRAVELERDGDHDGEFVVRKELLGLQKQEFGADDVRTLQTAVQLAEKLAVRTRLDEAWGYAEDAFERSRRQFGLDNRLRWSARAAFYQICQLRVEKLYGGFDGTPIDLTEARAVARRLLEDDAYAFVGTNRLAWIEYRFGDAKVGLELLNADLRRGWKTPISWPLRAGLHGKLGDKDSARDWIVVAQEHMGLTSDWQANLTRDPYIKEFARHVTFAETPPSIDKEPMFYVGAYDRLIAKHPEAVSLYSRRGLCHARLGDWKKAVADYEKAFRLNPNDCATRLNWAMACIQSANKEGYQEGCRAASHIWDDVLGPNEFSAVVAVCSLSSDSGVDQQEVLKLAAWIEQWLWLLDAPSVAKGMAFYRCDRIEDALQYLQGVRGNARDDCLAQCFQALAHKRLGNSTKAVAFLADARKTLKEDFPKWTNAEPFYPIEKPLVELMLRTALREAESLIEPAGTAMAPAAKK